MQEFFIYCMLLIVCGVALLYFTKGKSQLEETMELFDKCLIDYQKQTTDTHVFLIIYTGTGKVVGVNTDEIRWKFNLDGTLYMVEAI